MRNGRPFRPLPVHDWDGLHVVVAGAGVTGVAVAEALLERGAEVTVLEREASDRTDLVASAGARVLLKTHRLPKDTHLVVTSPGWSPRHPLLLAAAAAGIEVFSEPELAWRLRPAGAAPWYCVTGTNGKTTTTTMLASMFRAAGVRATAVGNIGESVLAAALRADDPYDALAVELSSFQLHWSSTLAPTAAAVLNLAEDHLDWHGGYERYAATKFRIWDPETVLAVGNADDPVVSAQLASRAAPSVTFTLGPPSEGQLGVQDGHLVDRAFGDRVELAAVEDVRPPGQHNIANALAAAVLARRGGVPAEAVGRALRGYVPEPHRVAEVGTLNGVDFVDDSKATNPHAARASLTSFDQVVWVAGGQLKGVDVDDLVRTVAPRLRGAVLLGKDKAQFAAALRRHAPLVPIIAAPDAHEDPMAQAVKAAYVLARPGDTVLLAPAAASLDMFASYAARGDAFARAVRGLGRIA